MANLNNKNLKLAIQKNGRLTDETISFLRSSGLEFESFSQRLFSTCNNFPLEILYLRVNDIADYVSSGAVDLGIIGENIFLEKRPKAKKILKLKFGFCSLVIAVKNDSNIISIKNLNNKIIATTYPKTTKNFLKRNNITSNIVCLNGSVEIAPALGVAEAIVDLTSTGATLAQNNLRILTKIYDSEAVLIANKQTLKNGKRELLNKLLSRLMENKYA